MADAPVEPCWARVHTGDADRARIAAAAFVAIGLYTVIALEAEDMLRNIGADDITTVGSAADALRRIDSEAPDYAVLDVNLGSSNSLAVADELKLREIPFVFATGYGDSVMIPDQLNDVPVVRKPYTETALIAALNRVPGLQPRAK